LGKKLYSHCLSHPAVKPGATYIVLCDQGTAEKQLWLADAVIPEKKKKQARVLRRNFQYK